MEPSDLFLVPDLTPEQVYEFLGSLGLRDPRRADLHLQHIVATVGTPERLAEVAPPLFSQIAGSPDPDAALRNLESFFESVPSPLNLISLMERDLRAVEILMGLLGSSPSLTQTLLRNPEYLYWLLEGSRLDRVQDAAYFRHQTDEVSRPFEERGAALDALRRLQRRESLRIGAQDILRLASMEEVVSQISDLADAILDQTLSIVAEERFGTAEVPFSVIGLGKLGGHELNFSSDVDLIFLYGDREDPVKMSRFARDYLKCLGEYTGAGHLYRVDMRLRPMGRSGEIAYSESATAQYYKTWADTTDRLALIKSRPVAGDRDLGERFVSSMQEFIFKGYLDFAAVEEIRWIKRRIDKSLREKKESQTNVKLGLGGIREVEFFVQSFQILYGHKHPQLRATSTLDGLRRLADNGFIEPKDFEALRSAYVFLRDLEHKLQLVHDLQTHQLPRNEEELARCARRMGYSGNSDTRTVRRFQRELDRHVTRVRSIFDALFENGGQDRELSELALNPNTDDRHAVQRLTDTGVVSAEEMWEGIKTLLQAPAYPQSPSRLRNLLANLLPILADELSHVDDPRTPLNRLDRFCDALGTRATLYSELVENPDFTRRLLTLLRLRESIVETLIRNPELLDSIVSPTVPEDFSSPLETALEKCPPDEDCRDISLRHFKQRETFKIAVQLLSDPWSAKSRKELTSLAEACIKAAWKWTVEEHHWIDEEAWILAGLGKLGGRELAFHSDLDLIFLFDDQGSSREANDFGHLLKSFREHLSRYTEAGRGYEVDLRLRPEGKHTAEAIPLSRFHDYFHQRALAWERLAYVKARPVLRQNMERDPTEVVYRWPFSRKDLEQLAHIRERKEKELTDEKEGKIWNLKMGRGSLLDLQFIVQILQVQAKVKEPNLLLSIDKLIESKKVSPPMGEKLRKSTRFLYGVEMVRDLMTDRDGESIPRKPEANKELATILGFESGREFLDRYEKVTSEVRQIYQEVVSG